ncbi:MAG: family transcriptional regulator, partial [Hymenobacter sp.]|nr:family transcriptional regulator [Hymenobacter sp.]
QGHAAAHARRAHGLAQLQAALGPAPLDAAEARWLRELAEDVAAAAPGPAAATAQVLLALRIAALTAEAEALAGLLAAQVDG